MSLADDLSAILATLLTSPANILTLPQPSIVNVSIVPSLQDVVLAEVVTTDVAAVIKAVRFDQPQLPSNDLGTANDSVLGGQPMPAVSLNVAESLLGGTLGGFQVDQSNSATNELAGVPGLLARLSGVPAGVLQVKPSLSVHWTIVRDSDGQTWEFDLGPSIAFLPPLTFVALTSAQPPLQSFTVKAHAKLTAAGVSKEADLPPLTVGVPAIQVPQFLAISTWRQYGKVPTGNDNPDDNSLLVVVPNDSTLGMVAQKALHDLLVQLSNALSPLSTITAASALILDPATPWHVAGIVDGLDALAQALTYTQALAGSHDYVPFQVVSADTSGTAVLGPWQTIDIYFDAEREFPFITVQHDHYYDHAQSIIYLGIPGDNGVAVTNNQSKTLKVTPGSGAFVGIPDLRSPLALDQFHPPTPPVGWETATSFAVSPTDNSWWGEGDKGIYTVKFE